MGCERPEKEYWYSSTLSLTSALVEGGRSMHTMTDLPLGKRPGTRWLRWLGWPQHWSGWVWKISPHRGIRPPYRAACSNSLYRLCCTSSLFHIPHIVKVGVQNFCRGLLSVLSDTFKIVGCYSRGVHIFKNSRNHLRILGAKRDTWSKFLPENVQDIRCHCTKFSCHGDLTHVNYAPLCYGMWGHVVVQLVEALHYKPEVHGFDSWWCHWNFSLTWYFWLYYGPGVHLVLPSFLFSDLWKF
jgi:hypothetical protein